MALCGVFLLIIGCVAVPKVQVPFRRGAKVETLASMVAISVKNPQMSTGGNGYLIYQRPDRFHMVILTPFGTTALETFSVADRLTIVIPSKGALFDPMKRGAVEKSSSTVGEITSFYDGAGLLERKIFSEGEEVHFREYRSADGVPFPTVMEFTDRNGSRVKITFDEPEINKPVDDAALVPNLEGVTLLPLASFKGM
jgi:hypothetical protein